MHDAIANNETMAKYRLRIIQIKTNDRLIVTRKGSNIPKNGKNQILSGLK